MAKGIVSRRAIRISDFERDYLIRLGKRLWRKVKRLPDGCWIWQGCKGKPPRNYGSIGLNINGIHTQVLVHRLVMALKLGCIDSEKDVCHRCDNPECCNPSHLFVGSHRDNMIDMVKKGRHVSVMSPDKIKKGEDRAFAKLSKESVTEIRELYSAGNSMQSLSRQYGVAASTVGKIVRREKWKHIA